MANYQGVGRIWASFTADNDLTAHQYKLVTAASTTNNVGSSNSACSPFPIGVLQNDPSAGQEALVAVLGFCKAKCRVNGACILQNGAFLTGASNGFLESIPGDEPIMGRYFGPRVTTADASVLGDVMLFPVGTCAVAGLAWV